MTHPKKFFAKKSFGQNFLVDKRVIQKIIDCCDLNSEDILLEIGAGKGALTSLLAEKTQKVFAVEKDNFLAEELRNNFNSFDKNNVSIIHQDILNLDFKTLPPNIKVVGNLPYNIATPIIEKIIEHRWQINSFYITVQMEYGKRLTACPNSKDFSPLSCFMQYYTRPEILFTIKNTCFSPKPKVMSCFVKITFLPTRTHSANDEKKLFFIIHRAFQQRRKNLLNALSFIDEKKDRLKSLLSELNIDPQARPENLTLDDYIKIANTVSKQRKT
ncbi:MAG TPA: 16S rRNA (adenine(1518)-N(6)/adenine(1519)-N(6))-dimethyltransferase RsmA [Candidatus Omnitrophota bacterium]|nr:16S rRNA (adenine(1518)-N(6)/adenine(1519)-N(6))-dimethyltransferase RsmA [Candidatus Omnitrophota bacterium]